MKFLILGCNGMAGHTTALYLKEKGHDVYGLALEKSSLLDIPTFVGDARNEDFVRRVVCDGEYDAVVDLIGVLTKAADDNKSLATYLNSYLPHFLADITSGTKTQIIYKSTDCVFSGKKGNYTTEDIPDGQSFYARSKALGELTDDKNLTIRTSLIGPDLNADGSGLFNWFMNQHGEINGFTGAMWTGLTSVHIGRVIEECAKNRISGICHVVPERSISKYDLLCMLNRHFRNGSVKINPTSGVCADKSLVPSGIEFGFSIPDYESMICDMLAFITSHKNLYPHYNL